MVDCSSLLFRLPQMVRLWAISVPVPGAGHGVARTPVAGPPVPERKRAILI
ncbi:MAG: hypothetical protein MUC60_06660 [Oscillatoria sp. Prado101]|nr:hypothetical protein [Oscillatoria sp. Prado101]